MGRIAYLFFPFLIAGSLLAKPNIEWLRAQSMLEQSKEITQQFAQRKCRWQRSYAHPKPLSAIDAAQNWITSYPPSLITEPGESVLAYLGQEDLWKALYSLGIDGIHLGPLQRAGGIEGMENTPSTDGGFDRISLALDPMYGSYPEYLRMVEQAAAVGSVVIGDLIPAHSGLGADFQLALAGYEEYPGIYHMVEIDRRDWRHLPKVEEGWSQNLTRKQVDCLQKKGYIVGSLETTIFFHPQHKVSNWDVTKPIRGVDGKMRRWVYLHYFKSSQPSYNWLDPSFGAQRIAGGDALFALCVLKNQIVRLDANSFLGVEIIEYTKKAWSESHPLAIDASNTLAMLIRKFGGYSFQELNLGASSLAEFTRSGADLSYDFLTRAAYINALIHGNCDLLKIAYRLMQECQIDPRTLIHALQNHDELNYELKYLKEVEGTLSYHGESFFGTDLRKKIQEEDLVACGSAPFYNHVSPEGLCSTMVGICAGALGINNVYDMSKKERQDVEKAHLLCAFFNAMQPGVFAISLWDIVGALPLRKKESEPWTQQDADQRWHLRGAIDLLHCSDAATSFGGLPKAKTLYAPLARQLKDPHSFASKVRSFLLARKSSHLAKAVWLGVLPTKHPGIFVLLHRLPGTGALQISACNFTSEPIEERLTIPGIEDTSALNLLSRKAEKKAFRANYIDLLLAPLEGKALVFAKGPPPLEESLPAGKCPSHKK